MALEEAPAEIAEFAEVFKAFDDFSSLEYRS
jgi:hypothetical protein